MRRFRVVSVLLLLASAVGLGAAAAAGAFAATPATAQLRVDTAHTAHSLPQAHPASALMRRVFGNEQRITPAPHQPHKVSSAAAGRAALAWWRRGPHSRALGTALAYVTEPYLGKHRLMWLVSLDLAGGLTNPGGPSTGAPGPDNFIVAFVDAKTGQTKLTSAGQSNLLPPLPVIHG